MIAEHTDGKPTVRRVAERESSRQEQRGPTARQIQFAQLVASGLSQAETYRRVFHPKAKSRRAAERGCRMAALPSVATEIARIRARSEGKKLLTLNERLDILADGAQSPESKWRKILAGNTTGYSGWLATGPDVRRFPDLRRLHRDRGVTEAQLRCRPPDDRL